MMGFVKKKSLDLVCPVLTVWQSWMFASLFILDKKINEVPRFSCHKLTNNKIPGCSPIQYLESVRPVLSEERFKKMEKLAEQFKVRFTLYYFSFTEYFVSFGLDIQSCLDLS